jgi:hypothetical protein
VAWTNNIKMWYTKNLQIYQWSYCNQPTLSIMNHKTKLKIINQYNFQNLVLYTLSSILQTWNLGGIEAHEHEKYNGNIDK